MADDLLLRLERAVRRFGGPLPIDDLLPELDAESSVYLSSGTESEEVAPGEAEASEADPAAGWRELESQASVDEGSRESREVTQDSDGTQPIVLPDID